MRSDYRPRRAARWVVGLLACVGACSWILTAPGCRRVEAPAPTVTAEQWWTRAAEAMAAGDVDRAAACFDRSLAMEDRSELRRQAAVELATAGRADLAAGFVAGRGEPDLAAMARAIEIFQSTPPPGHEEDPYVIPAMAEAVAALDLPAPPAVETAALTLRGEHVIALIHAWRSWLEFGAASLSPAPRVAALWLSGEMDAKALGRLGFIVQPTGSDGLWAAHMGFWPVGDEAFARDAAAFVSAGRGRAELWLVARTEGGLWSIAAVTGELSDGAMVIDACRGAELIEPLTALLGDSNIRPGRVLAADEARRREIVAIVERQGMAGRLAAHGAILTADDANADVYSEGQWLADIAGYVVYGRAALRGAWPELGEAGR